jgi:GxxExxY protein
MRPALGGDLQGDRWSQRVIAAAAAVHRALGPGLLDSVYRLALIEELRDRGIPFEQHKTVPIRYRGLVLVTGIQLDLLVGGELIVEVLSVDRITDWHRARLLTHLRFSECAWGVSINFNVRDLRRGIRRVAGPSRRRGR